MGLDTRSWLAVSASTGLPYAPSTEEVCLLLRKDPDPLVRASAAEALWDLGHASVLTALEDSLADEDESVRAYVANSIGLLGSATSVGKVASYIESEQSPRVRAEILGAMYRLGGRASLQALLDLLEACNEDLATPILNILTGLIQRKFPPTLRADAPRIKNALIGLADTSVSC